MKARKLSDGGDVAARRSGDWWQSFGAADYARASFVGSTGCLYEVLEQYGFEIRVVNAHHLTRLVYRMLRYGQNYVEQGIHQYELKFQLRRIKWLRREA